MSAWRLESGYLALVKIAVTYGVYEDLSFSHSIAGKLTRHLGARISKCNGDCCTGTIGWNKVHDVPT